MEDNDPTIDLRGDAASSSRSSPPSSSRSGGGWHQQQQQQRPRDALDAFLVRENVA